MLRGNGEDSGSTARSKSRSDKVNPARAPQSPTHSLLDEPQDASVLPRPLRSGGNRARGIEPDILSLVPSRNSIDSTLPRLPGQVTSVPLQILQHESDAQERPHVGIAEPNEYQHEIMSDGDMSACGPHLLRPTTAPARFAAPSISPSGGWGTPLPPGRRVLMADGPSDSAA